MMKENDTELIDRLNEGDERAFTALYQKYVAQVFDFLLQLLKDESLAEDITQHCFMQIWIHHRTISSSKNFPSYLFVTAKNAAYMEFRRQLTAEKYVDFALRSHDEGEEGDYGKVDMKMIEKEVKKVLAALPESRKQIFMMRFLDGMKSSEIAEKLGISTKTVDAQISRVKIVLRKAVSEILVMMLFFTTVR